MNKENNTESKELALKMSGELVQKKDSEINIQALNKDICRKLIQEAMQSLKYSYSPYSGYQVGAALLTKDMNIYTSCNIENVAYTPTSCAERNAFFKAVSEGKKEFQAIAIVGGRNGIIKDYCSPCGVCRQVMLEFCNPDSFYIILARSEEDYWIYRLGDFMPVAFGPDRLNTR